ncbi:MAG: proprotein convertase P-domain-containing protein, partial [Pirellulaceae bacterium]|nr:proprotein convertase P-domain-containing protein [Pirellulaceae bacterium]
PFNGGQDLDVPFILDQGTKIISVVPQPVVRDPVTGALLQAKNQIEVHFNSRQLDPATAANPAFYQLVDEWTGALLFPQHVDYAPDQMRAVLQFAHDLPDTTFHLRIGVSDEPNDSRGTAVNVGTIAQRAEHQVYSSPVQLDVNGDPISTPIRDNETAISRISVSDTFLVRDVDVLINMDHQWTPDLRVFLVSPSGDRVELMRDVGVGVLGGQIYGNKYHDADGDGVHDEDEPGLPGWTIYIDANLNGRLDPGELSTVTDAAGDYSFLGLELGKTYRIAEVPQPLWAQTAPDAGGWEERYRADFGAGAEQTLRIIPDPAQGDPTRGSFALEFLGRVTESIEYAGPNAVTAGRIEAALEAIVDPGVDVTVAILAGSPIRFQLAFARRGVGTPVDQPIVGVTQVNLDRGSLAVDTVGSTDAFSSIGPANQWHLSSGRGREAGHTGQHSFYFGAGEKEGGNGQYQNNANGTLISPDLDLRDQRLTGRLLLGLNHFLNTESGFDFAEIDVVNAEGVRTNLFSTSSSTSGFQPLQLELTEFVGQVIHLEFTFTSDSSVTAEGWFVDDIHVAVERGVHNVTLSSEPTGAIVKHVDFGGSRGATYGPDTFGYEAFAIGAQFDDITDTGQPALQEFVDSGYAVQAGGAGADESQALARDAAGNLYVTGTFSGQATFGAGAAAVTLVAAGSTDIFLAKYAPDGALIWAIGMGGAGSDLGSDVGVDGAGNVLVTGRFSNTADFDPSAGTTALTSVGGTDAFVARYTSAGALDWVRPFGGAQGDAGLGLAVAPAGNVVVTGYFSGTVDFDPGPGISPRFSAGDNDIFVVMLTAAGQLTWAQQYGSTGTDQGRAVAIDHAGRILVGGSFVGTVDFDPGPAVMNRTSAGLSDGFVLQITSGGSTIWARRFGGTAADAAHALAADRADRAVVVGVSNGDVLLSAYSASGTLAWTRSFGGDASDLADAVAIDSLDRILVTGAFRTEVDFDPGPREVRHTSAGGRDVFVARFTTAGGLDFVRVSGSTLDDFGTGIVVDDFDDAIYTGAFRETVNFSIGADEATLTSRGASDVFLAKQAVIQGLDDDTAHLTIADLNGFRFAFYGVEYDELFFSSNGLVTFGTPNADGQNTDLTDPPPQASIAVFWEDLVTGSGDREAVFWEVKGSGDDQRLIIQWNDVRLAGPFGATQEPLNFQVVLSERENSIQLNYATVSGARLVASGVDQRVGSFGTGQQHEPAVAADADGDYVIIWTADGQDGSGTGIYARRYNPAGVPLSGEFRVNSTTSDDEAHPRVAMNASGRFVVVWDTTANGGDVLGQIFDAAGNRVGTEFQVNANSAERAERPAVVMDDAGNFVVMWNGSGADDADGVYARRFTAAGLPLDTVNEIQHVEILGPPAAASTFSLSLAGETTAAIAFA